MATNMFSLGEAFSKPVTSPVFNWKDFVPYFYPGARNYRNFIKPGGEQSQLYDQFKTDYLAGTDDARANAKVYQDYAKGLFSNQPDQFANYQQVGDYLYGKFDDFRDTSAASGMRDMNSQLARLGIRPGSTGYDRLLNANRITNNLAPAFANTTNAIGRDYGQLSNNDWRETMLRLGMAQDDSLSGYMDNVYARPLDVANVRSGQLAGNNQLYQDLVNAFKTNVAGFETKETSDVAKGIGVVDNLLNGVVDLYMSAYGGGMGGMGGGGGQAGSGKSANPYLAQLFGNNQQMPAGGYPSNPGTSTSMPPNQGNAWLNEFYGGQDIGSNPYLGDVNINPYTLGAV